MARPIVVLPEPDSPTRPTTSPWPIVRLTPSTARNAGARPRFGYSMATSREVDDERLDGAPASRPACRVAPTLAIGARPPSADDRHRGAAPRRAAAGCTGACGALEDLDSTCPTRRSGPAASRCTRSDRSATTPMSWVISRIAGVDAVAQVAHQLEDLGLHRDVERRRRLVGDEQLRVAAPAPGRSSPAGAGRRTAGAGRRRRAAPGRGSRPASSSSIARCRAAFGAIAWWLRSISAIWKPMVYTGLSAVIGSWKMTDDLPAADLAQRALVDADQLLAAELDRAAHVSVLRQQTQQRHRRRSTCPIRTRRRSPAPRRVQVERGVDDRRVPGAVDPEVDVEVAHREDRRVRSVRGVTGTSSRDCGGCHDGRRARTCSGRAFGRVLRVVIGGDLRRRRRRSSLVVTDAGDAAGAARRGWLLVGGACWAVFWRPARRSSTTAGCALVNVLRTIDVPWPAIQAIDTKWALTLITAYGQFTAWAAPAPGTQRGGPGAERDAEHLPDDARRRQRHPAGRPALEPVGRRGDGRSGGAGSSCATPVTSTTRGSSTSGRRSRGTSATIAAGVVLVVLRPSSAHRR